jgi:hypothetical protein
MPHKRSPQGKQNQANRKQLKRQAKQYITINSFHDLENSETAYMGTPTQATEHLKILNPEKGFKIISPLLYGSILVESEFGVVAQAAQGLVSEGIIKY